MSRFSLSYIFLADFIVFAQIGEMGSWLAIVSPFFVFL